GTWTTGDDVAFELAMYRAYHRWMQDYCGAFPDRLGGVIPVCARDVAASAHEMRACGNARRARPVVLHAHVGAPPDHAAFATVAAALPKLRRLPSEYVTSGRYFQSIEIPEGAPLTNVVADLVGDGVLMYASDYPHGESHFPKSVDTVLGWPMTESRKRALFWD